MRSIRVFSCAACVAIACVVVSGCSSTPSRERHTLTSPQAETSLPAYAEGLSFVRDSVVWTVRGGRLREAAPHDDAGYQRDVAAVDGSENLLVTVVRGGSARVVEVTARAGGAGRTVYRSKAASLLGPVRMDGPRGRLYVTVFGEPAAELVVTTPGAAIGEATVAPVGSFSGDFDVDSGGDLIVYTTAEQDPASLKMLASGDRTTLTTRFAMAFTPSISPDGRRVCFAGATVVGGPIEVWVVDVASGNVRAVPGTSGLKPAFPVFSPDGARIAFRCGRDGSIWTVRPDGGAPERLPLTADETALAW